jgi:phosphoglycerate kinase
MLSKKIGLDHITNFIKSSRVLMRVDFNVPVKDGVVKDATRVQKTLPTLNKVLENNPRNVVLMSHLGRPNGERVEKHSLKPVVPILEDLLKKKVTFLDECVGK